MAGIAFAKAPIPLVMQYASEIAYPTPKGTSNGFIRLFGQGVVIFVGSFTLSLALMTPLFAASAFLLYKEITRQAPKGNYSASRIKS